jgi:DNA excision repair protein ERCC-2
MARRVGRIIMGLSPPKTLLWERRGQSKAEKEDILKTLQDRQREAGHLLMAVQGGSLSEGIDYPGNLLRAVIVAGLGLSPPQIEVEALRSFYSSRFGRRKGYEYAYLYPALNRLVQCAGRCIRSEEDVAAVIVLDNRLLRPFYRSRLPEGFSPIPCRDLSRRVRSFFYERHHLTDGADQARSGGGPQPDGVDGQEGGGEGQAIEGVPPPPSR